MNRLRTYVTSSLIPFAAAILPLAALTGCAIGAAFPDASTNPQQVPLGTIQGTNYGGHAPLIGAHVYVLQPSVTTATATGTSSAEYNAYGGRATSLLTASYQNNGQGTNPTTGFNYNVTTQNSSDPGIPTSWYYLTTDLTGAFNISGDYTCTAGLPVYLYLYGGSPTYPSANNNFTVTQATVSGASGTAAATFTFTVSQLENFYIGEEVTLSGFTGNFAYMNGSTQVVQSTNLTTSTVAFSIGNSNSLTNGTYTTGAAGGNILALPSFNSGVVNLAVLGNCPSGGFVGSNAISYVYVNEVSTVAAAYAFRPFTLTPQSGQQNYQTDCLSTYNGNTYDWNNATCIGTSSNNLAGLQNAANIAKQLYDITGSNISTYYAGEGHIARSLTTNQNGIVPQANLDTLGNIIAACVDSNNGSTTVGNTGGTYTSGAFSGISPQCNTLFSTATSTGVLSTASGGGIQPYDTAMAAFNIARHPGGPPSGSGSTAATFMSNLYTLPQGNRPFQPDIASTAATQPNDFTIGIYYPSSLNTGANGGSYTNGAESVALDNIGNAWVAAQNNGSPYYFYEISPTGVISNVQHQTSFIYGYVAVDTNQNAWAGAAIDTLNYNNTTPAADPVTYVKKTGTTSSTSVYPNPYTYSAGATNSTKLESFTYAAAADTAGNVYFGNNGTYSSNNLSGRPNDYIETFSGAATTPTVTGTESAQIPTFTSVDGGISHMAMQPSGGSAYIDYNNSDGNGTAYLASVVLSSGSNNYTEVTPSTTNCTGLVDPEAMAVTRNGDGLFPDYHKGGGTINTASSSLYFLTSLTTSGSGTCAQISGATYTVGLNSPFGVTIDGNDYAYITNRGNNNGNTISILNMQSSTSTVANVSPSTGLQPTYVASGGTSLSYELSGPLNIAAGPSGELWVTNFTGGNSLVEIIGLAYPTVTPLASAAFTNAGYTGGTVGTRP